MKIVNRKVLLAAVLWMIAMSPAGANVIRPINGTYYEFMEMSPTTSTSRVQIESMMADPTSSFYGFRYASRLETQYLLDSYGPLPTDLNVFYSNLADGAAAFFNDFGSTFTENLGQTYQMTTQDGVLINYNQAINTYFLHGAPDECGIGESCVGRVYAYALDGVIQAWDPVGRRGADAYNTNPDLYLNTDSNFILGSLLMSEVTVVPVPAAAWLFSSGLIGLLTVSLRRKDAKKS